MKESKMKIYLESEDVVFFLSCEAEDQETANNDVLNAFYTLQCTSTAVWNDITNEPNR